MSRPKTGFIFDPLFLEHHTGSRHPESKERLTSTMSYLEKQAWFDKLVPIKARTAEIESLLLVHGFTYIQRAEKACQAHMRILDTPDVAISPQSYEAALKACGAALSLCDQVASGEINNGFALVRPPGHHAEREFAMGFCLFNNVAVAARYLQKKHGLSRILILDWDAHHGNGTQHIFEDDPSVFYISLHQYPFYPGTGSAWETGSSSGAGATLNCPMKAEAGDAEYLEAFQNKIRPAVTAFKPDAILLSSGFDAHALDPLAQLRLESASYRWMTKEVMEWADRFAGGRIISLLEGGYHLEALAECVGVHLQELSGNEKLPA